MSPRVNFQPPSYFEPNRFKINFVSNVAKLQTRDQYTSLTKNTELPTQNFDSAINEFHVTKQKSTKPTLFYLFCSLSPFFCYRNREGKKMMRTNSNISQTNYNVVDFPHPSHLRYHQFAPKNRNNTAYSKLAGASSR